MDPRRTICKDSGFTPTNEQAGILYEESAFDPNSISDYENTLRPISPRIRASCVRGELLQSPFLVLLRVYFFWQLFQTGQGKLAHIENNSDYFASLGIPLPTLNAYMAGATETFGNLLLIVGLASRLTAIPITVVMAVAYLTADLEAVTGIFSTTFRAHEMSWVLPSITMFLMKHINEYNFLLTRELLNEYGEH